MSKSTPHPGDSEPAERDPLRAHGVVLLRPALWWESVSHLARHFRDTEPPPEHLSNLTPQRIVDIVHRDDTELHLAISLEKNITASQTRGIHLSSRKAVPTSRLTEKFPLCQLLVITCFLSHLLLEMWKAPGCEVSQNLGEGGPCLTHVSVPCHQPCKGKFNTDLS